jgi:sialate O-acetylesterase
MKIKGLCFVLLLLMLAACKKNTVTPIKAGAGPSLISFNSLFQNNMVVQRDKPLVIWGASKANSKINLNVSWSTTTVSTIADTAGNWTVNVPSAAASSNPQTIMAASPGFDPVIITNVLIGDVWVCSGQSNMTYPVDSIAPFRGVLNYKAEIAAANYPSIRMLTVPFLSQAKPSAIITLPMSWSVCSPTTVGPVSAVAYYFAQKLNTALSVPIGIIVASDNGSYCQDWTNTEAIASNTTLLQSYGFGTSALYNGMINPLTKMQVKGFIWYQGENNQHDEPVSNYTLLNTALIQGWRYKFVQPLLPFYYVQLTPFAEDYNSTNPVGGNLTSDYLAKFREAQANILPEQGKGMAITMDVGEADNHHPRNKKPVGERLALLALKNTYNQNVQCYGPHYSSFSANGNVVTVNFSAGTAEGLNTTNNAPLNQYFFVAGADQVFRQGTAVINGTTITITAQANTPLPIQAVRYAFTNAPVTNLQNSAGLPAEPFRTDNWNN